MNDDVRKRVEEWCHAQGIPLLGIAPIQRWETRGVEMGIPKEFFPQSIYPETRSVIVLGLPISLPILNTAPSIWYHELYTTLNTLLDQYSYRLSLFLSEQGYPSVFVPRDGYAGIEALKKNPVSFFSHRHAAFFAGLGTFGVNNMLLSPQYGPRVRFGSVFTAAELPSDPVMENEMCTRCMRCVESCPVQALDEGEYPTARTRTKACVDRSAELNLRGISPCGLCIRICPVGHDRSLFRQDDDRLYEDSTTYGAHHRAWEHVRRYGNR